MSRNPIPIAKLASSAPEDRFYELGAKAMEGKAATKNRSEAAETQIEIAMMSGL